MFKKPIGNLKTSAPLRGSDRRKFKQRVVATFGVSSEEGDQLVPEGLQSIKFSTHINEQGVAYLGPEGDPLWFTIGKGSDELIPTIYTLWKKRNLVPFVSTPPSVIPFLVGGADLMIPGVIHRPTQSIAKGQLVSVCQYDHKEEKPTLSAPLAIGHMAISSNQMTEDGKGKAVLMLHAWKDHLWDMGSKIDLPESSEMGEDIREENKPQELPAQEQEPFQSAPLPPTVSYTSQEITDILQKSLLQAISTILCSLPTNIFPIPSTQFYTNYILPCRPATATNDVTIKTSTHKSLTTFLKAAEKTSLLTLKSPQKHSKQTDLLVMSVNKTHPSVDGHVKYETMKDAEEKAAKKAKREEKGKEGGKKAELGVRLLWKPHIDTAHLFENIGADPKALYTMHEIKSLLNSYVSSQNLVNPNDKAYINLDDLLRECAFAKGEQQQSNKKQVQDDEDEDASSLGREFIKREELAKRVIAKMQDWYEIVRDGEVTQKKGTLKPIQVVTKARQGRKASTYITGFEPFITVEAETVADELRRLCASATSVTPLPGKQTGLEVMVQGKQSQAALEYLTGNGAPKQWIELVER